jgi:uncharacterized protein YeaC (DUF1315 family)
VDCDQLVNVWQHKHNDNVTQHTSIIFKTSYFN